MNGRDTSASLISRETVTISTPSGFFRNNRHTQEISGGCKVETGRQGNTHVPFTRTLGFDLPTGRSVERLGIDVE